MSFLFVFRDKCLGHRPTQLGSGLEQSGHRPQSDLHPWTSLACESSLVSLTTCPPNKELRDCLSLSLPLCLSSLSLLWLLTVPKVHQPSELLQQEEQEEEELKEKQKGRKEKEEKRNQNHLKRQIQGNWSC